MSVMSSVERMVGVDRSTEGKTPRVSHVIMGVRLCRRWELLSGSSGWAGRWLCHFWTPYGAVPHYCVTSRAVATARVAQNWLDWFHSTDRPITRFSRVGHEDRLWQRVTKLSVDLMVAELWLKLKMGWGWCERGEGASAGAIKLRYHNDEESCEAQGNTQRATQDELVSIVLKQGESFNIVEPLYSYTLVN